MMSDLNLYFHNDLWAHLLWFYDINTNKNEWVVVYKQIDKISLS
jgi:hypothetical protein